MKIVHENHVLGDYEEKGRIQRILNETIEKEDSLKVLDTKELHDKKYDLNKTFYRIFSCLNYRSSTSILDLGCWSTIKTVESEQYWRKYEPYLARALYLSQSKTYIKEIIWVDCSDLSKEVFPHKELDLLKKDILKENFEKESFDLVYAGMLFNSPELEKRTTGIYSKDDACDETSIHLKNILLPQIKHLLKPEGIFLYQGGWIDLFKNEEEYVTIFQSSYMPRTKVPTSQVPYWYGF